MSESGKCPCFNCCKARDDARIAAPDQAGEEWIDRLNTMETNRFIVCPNCGNKRCPHATDHTLGCTQSNEPNQPGSRYSHAPLTTAPASDQEVKP